MTNKLHWWCVSFYEMDLHMTVKCELMASSFDEALAKARTVVPRFDTGYVIGWREEQ